MLAGGKSGTTQVHLSDHTHTPTYVWEGEPGLVPEQGSDLSLLPALSKDRLSGLHKEATFTYPELLLGEKCRRFQAYLSGVKT